MFRKRTYYQLFGLIAILLLGFGSVVLGQSAISQDSSLVLGASTPNSAAGIPRESRTTLSGTFYMVETDNFDPHTVPPQESRFFVADKVGLPTEVLFDTPISKGLLGKQVTISGQLVRTAIPGT